MDALDFLWRSLVMFAVVFAAIRVLGKRTMANLTPMDRVAGITFGTVAGSTAVSMKDPLYGGILVITSFAAISWIVGHLAAKRPALRPLLMGTPRELVRQGHVDHEALRKAGMSQEDLIMRLREAQIDSTDQVRLATLEPDGKLGIIPEKS